VCPWRRDDWWLEPIDCQLATVDRRLNRRDETTHDADGRRFVPLGLVIALG
jgi:hypothetical protein